jgi:hypothetical protein
MAPFIPDDPNMEGSFGDDTNSPWHASRPDPPSQSFPIYEDSPVDILAPWDVSHPGEQQVIQHCESITNTDPEELRAWERRRQSSAVHEIREPRRISFSPVWSSVGISPIIAPSEPRLLSIQERANKDLAQGHLLAKETIEGNRTLEDVVISSWMKIKHAEVLTSESARHIKVLRAWIEVRAVQLKYGDLCRGWRSPSVGRCTLPREPHPARVAEIFEQAMLSSSCRFIYQVERELSVVAGHYSQGVDSPYPWDESDLDSNSSPDIDRMLDEVLRITPREPLADLTNIMQNWGNAGAH